MARPRPVSTLSLVALSLVLVAGLVAPARAGLDFDAFKADKPQMHAGCPSITRWPEPVPFCTYEVALGPIDAMALVDAKAPTSAKAPTGATAVFGSFLMADLPPGSLSLESLFAGGGAARMTSPLQRPSPLAAVPLGFVSQPLRAVSPLLISDSRPLAPGSLQIELVRPGSTAATVIAGADASGLAALPEPAGVFAVLSGLPCAGGVVALARRRMTAGRA